LMHSASPLQHETLRIAVQTASKLIRITMARRLLTLAFVC
jgi:hypothetical protein